MEVSMRRRGWAVVMRDYATLCDVMEAVEALHRDTPIQFRDKKNGFLDKRHYSCCSALPLLYLSDCLIFETTLLFFFNEGASP